jgi:zinc protease
MTKKLLTILLAVWIIWPLSAADGDGRILPYTIHQYKMKNGLNVVTVPFESPGIASFYIVVRAGSRDEIEEGKTGFAHFFEHMMFRGTEKYSKEKYSDELKAIGASANANTSLDRTVYHMTGNALMLDKMFELEADRFQFLKYSVQDFKTEAGAVKGEYTKNSASPYVQLDEKVNDVAFDKHTYKHTTMGFYKDVVDMPNQYEYSLEFFRRFYRPEYTTLIVVGDVQPEKVNQMAEKYFGQWSRGEWVSKIPSEPVQTSTRYTHVKMPGFPPLVSLSYKSPAYNDSSVDAAALSLFCSITFSEKSPLYKKLVIQEQRVRDLNAGLSFTRDPYLLEIQASLVDAKELQAIKDELVSSIEEVKTKGVGQKELDETRTRMRYSFMMGMDSPERIAQSLSYYTWITGNPESLNAAYRLYDKVTVDDIRKAVGKYLKAENLTIGTISSDENSPVK